MRLNTFVITEGRGRDIGESDAVEGIRKHCKKAVDAYYEGTSLYRGVDGGGFIYIQPSKHVRISANTSNIYTVVMDNTPAWKSYPKRSQSIVCTNNQNTAKGYGNPYMVFPKDGSNFGICPENDLWQSFWNTAAGMDAMDINDSIENVASGVANYYPNVVTLSDLKKMCDAIDKSIRDNSNSWSKINGKMYGLMTKYYKGDFFDFLTKVFDPKPNNFKHTNNMKSLPKGDREIWTDGDSYLVSIYWLTQENIGKILA